ncbi:MAG TPA: 4'-phosphopantetheinyl transferase superfamily protein [Solirubrobacterales bacterium]|nr:4'-phosphopantetheinyl transferase superfamily protein [Solirubrobacterales bacterium]
MIDGVHIWRAALDEAGWPGPQELPPQERERAESFLREGAGRRWVAARWALRRTLAGYLGRETVEIALETDRQGKPRLRDGDGGGLRFNLSHSGGLALVAVTERRAVGVDVETIAPRQNLVALAERSLPAEEAAAVRAAAPERRLDAFYTAWVRHEARLKCLGTGLGAPAPPAATSIAPVDAAPGYAAAVAVLDSDIGPLRCRTLRAG